MKKSIIFSIIGTIGLFLMPLTVTDDIWSGSMATLGLVGIIGGVGGTTIIVHLLIKLGRKVTGNESNTELLTVYAWVSCIICFEEYFMYLVRVGIIP